MLRVRFKVLKQYIRESLAIDEEAWMPSRYYPSTNEPLTRDEQDRLNQPLGEVDTDPTNNPGRPDDAYDYLGMHPKPTAAMSPPSAGGGGSGGASGSDPSEPPDEPAEDAPEG